MPPTAEPAPAPGADVCPSCGGPRPGRFCPRCGERRVDPDDYRFRHFVAQAVDQVFNLDGTLWRTVRALVARPGLLTAEYLAGRRTRYTRPLQLFLLVNVAFFVLLGHFGTFRYPLDRYVHGRVGSIFLADTARVQALVAAKARREGVGPREFERRFDAASGAQQSVWLLTTPVFGVLVWGVYARWRRPFVQHLVFAVHFFAFLLLFVTALLTTLAGVVLGAGRAAVALRARAPEAAAGLARLANRVDDERVFGPVILAVVLAYLFLALRRVYPEPWGRTLARALVLAYVTPRFTDLYRDLLFAIAYWSV